MGFCFSYSEIVKKAKGKFLWIIGDDDCYNFYYLKQIIMFLEEKHPNLISFHAMPISSKK